MHVINVAKESLFLSYIRSVLKKWTGFQMAIDDGMGGPYSKEKEIWLGTEIENYFTLYTDVAPDDLEEYVGEMIENEFDTYFEDGSLLKVCEKFCEAYKLSLVNPDAPIFQDLKDQQQTKARENSTSQIQEEINTERSVVLDMDKLEIKDPEEEGWTTVTRKSTSVTRKKEILIC